MPLPDPNARMLEEMPEAKREAYDEALNGDVSDVLEQYEQGGEDLPPLDEALATLDQGCVGDAIESVDSGADDAWKTDEAAAALITDMRSVQARIDDDPRVADARETWAECMESAGHIGMLHPNDAYGEIQSLVEEAVEDIDLSGVDVAEGKASNSLGVDPLSLPMTTYSPRFGKRRSRWPKPITAAGTRPATRPCTTQFRLRWSRSS